jgi:hypothetical protein
MGARGGEDDRREGWSEGEGVEEEEGDEGYRVHQCD